MSYQPLSLQQSIEVEPVNEDIGPSPPSPLEHQEFHDFAFDPTIPRSVTTFDPTSPRATTESRTSKHAAHWSSSTNTTTVVSEKSSLRSDEKSRSERKARLTRNGTWTFEILALAIALGSVASIIGVVFRYNGRALPDWPHEITLNALIALLATVANAAMSVCLSSGLSQAKWIRFRRSAAPLSDMEVFDEASRGSWGSLKLIATARGGYVFNVLISSCG